MFFDAKLTNHQPDLLQAYTSTACGNDTTQSNLFSQQNQESEICQVMQNIDRTEFYNNYLLKVNFEGS